MLSGDFDLPGQQIQSSTNINGQTRVGHSEFSAPMSESQRYRTFENFPNKDIILKLYNSGFYYTDVEDNTICHRCGVSVSTWQDDDDPGMLHEIGCTYNTGAVKSKILPVPSIIDEPIEDTEGTAPLVPTILQPAQSAESAGMASANRPYAVDSRFPFGPIYVQSHAAMMKAINPRKEEDRRYTFTFNDAWKRNTNDVLPYKELAANGFFYLGNLKRTQCFSCLEVIGHWYRSDEKCIHRIHGENSEHCRMARGQDPTNVPSRIHHSSDNDVGTSSSQHRTLDNSNLLPRTLLTPARTDFDLTNTPHEHNSIQLSVNSVEVSTSASEKEQEQDDRRLFSNSSAGSLQISPYPGAGPETNYLPHTARGRLASSGEKLPVQVADESSEPHYSFENTAPSRSSSQYVGPARPYQGEEDRPQSATVIRQDTEEGVRHMETEIVESPFQCDAPQYPEMRDIDARRESFAAWWTNSDVSNTEDMAHAGFYCFDCNSTKCWYCGAVKRGWRPGDDPWEVHAELFPQCVPGSRYGSCAFRVHAFYCFDSCEYLLSKKGVEFVEDVRSRMPPSPPVSFLPPATPSPPHSPIYRVPSPNMSFGSFDESPYSSLETYGYHGGAAQPVAVIDPREVMEKRKRLLESSLDSELTMAAMEMGFELPMIKRVLKSKIRRTDITYPNPTALLDDLLNPPADLDPDSDDEDGDPVGNVAGASAASEVETQASGQNAPRMDIELPSDPQEMTEKLREIENEKRCKVCLDRDAVVLFIPCKHLCTCVDCARALRTCPLCRKRIQKSMKTYST